MIKFRRLHIGLLLATVVALGIGLAATQMTGADSSSSPQTTGYWQRVSAQTQTNELLSSGKLLPAQTIEITSPAGGTLAALAVTWGQSVTKGQVLGRIDSPELATQLRTAQVAKLRSQLQDAAALTGEEPSDVLSARQRLLSAQTALKAAQNRQRESSILYSKGFVSRNDDEAAKTEVQNTEQQLTLAREELKMAARKYAPDQLQALKLEGINRQAELAQLNERQNKLTLTAPLTGVVLYPQTKEQDARGEQPVRGELAVGVRVTSGESLMAIGDISSFLIRATCTEPEYAWLEAGANAEITSGALPELSFAAKVSKVLGQARSRRGGMSEDAVYEFEVVFAVPQLTEAQRRKLRVGSTVKLKVTQPSVTPKTSLPLVAVQWAPDGAAQVRWRLNASDTPQMKSIRVLRAGQSDVLLRDSLLGEVWIPGAAEEPGGPAGSATQTNSKLKRMFGFEE
jgi:HlyD family secretion protein